MVDKVDTILGAMFRGGCVCVKVEYDIAVLVPKMNEQSQNTKKSYHKQTAQKKKIY
jgi:hypothetical protein